MVKAIFNILVLIPAIFYLYEIKARHVNIAILVTKERDINSMALRNSIAWAHKHVLRGRGMTMRIKKIVVNKDNFIRDFFAIDLSNTSFILEPFHIDSRSCILSESLNIPLITIADIHHKICKGVLSMNPHPNHLYKVMSNLLREEDISTIEVIVEEGMSEVAMDMITYSAKENDKVYYSILATVNMSNEHEMHAIVTELQTEYHKYIMLIMRSYNALKFIKATNNSEVDNSVATNWFLPAILVHSKNDMPMGSHVHSLSIPVDQDRLLAVEEELDSMKTKYQKAFPGYKTIEPMLHDAIVAIATTIRKAPMDLSSAYRIIYPFKNQEIRSVSLKLTKEKVLFEGVTGKVHFTKDGYRNISNLEVEKIDKHGNVTAMGRWSEECQVFRSKKNKPVQRKQKKCNAKPKRIALSSKIRKRHLKVVTLPEAPLIYYNESFGEGKDRFRGFCKDLLEKLSNSLHFTYEIYIVPGKTPNYGACEDGKEGESCVWSGLIGEIVYKKADIGIGSITITSEREQYVDFSKPFMDFTMTLIMAKSEGKQFDMYAFLKPFEYSVWLSILAVALGVTIILFLIDRFSPNGCRKLSKKESSEFVGNEFAFHNCMWFTAASILQQGPDYTPKSSSARILSATFWFFTLIIISTYTANLAAFFTTNHQITGIKSLEDLAKQDKLEYGILGRGQTYSLFKNSEIPIYKQMFNFMRSRNSFATSSKLGVERVRKGGYAYLSEDPIIYYEHQRQPCDTAVLRNLLEAKSYGLVLQQQSDWTNSISVMILDLREQGFIEKLRSKWWDEESECQSGEQNLKGQPISLKISSLAGVYVIMIGGAVVACILLFIEAKYQKVLGDGKCLGQKYKFTKSRKMKNEITFIDHCETDQLDPVMQKIQNQMNISQEFMMAEKLKRNFYSPERTPPLTFIRYEVPEQYRDAPESTL